MTQSFSRFLLCAGLLGVSLTVSAASAQDAAPAGAQAAPPPATEDQVAPPAQEPPAEVVPPPTETTQETPSGDLTPPADEAAEEVPAEEPPPPAKKFWRNSLFLFTPSMTLYTFSPAAQLTYDPTVTMNFRLQPRFYLSDTLFIRLRQDIDVELTQSDADTYTRQPLLSDTTVDLIRPALISESGFTLTAGLRVTLPVSIASRFNNQIMGTGVVANLSYQLPDEEDLHLSVLFDFSYTHNWQSTNTPTHFSSANNTGSGSTICPGGANGCSVGGLTNTSDAFLFGPTLLWVPDGEHINVSATYYWVPRLAQSLEEETIVTGGGSTPVGDGQTHWRSLQYFGVSVAYDVLPWMNLSLTYGTFTTQLSPNGKFRNPVWGPDTTVSMTAVITLDQLYEVITGTGAELTPEQLRRIRNGQASAPRVGGAI